MKVVVLGSAADRGVPEWRCACLTCRGARSQRASAAPRSPASLAVSADGRRWFLLDVSTDVTRQLESSGALRADAGRAVDRALAPERSIAGVVLTNGALDHSLGLASLRERDEPLCLYATRETYAGLVVQSVVCRTLERCAPVQYRALELDVFMPLRDASGAASGLSVCAFSVPGEVPSHLRAFIEQTDETNVGLIVRDDQTHARILYVPGAASVRGIAERARDASCLFFDGTLWSEPESTPESANAARTEHVSIAAGHLPVSGPGGSLEQLDALPIPQRFYTHVERSNPMLLEGSAERRAVEARGWRVAEDGLELCV